MGILPGPGPHRGRRQAAGARDLSADLPGQGESVQTQAGPVRAIESGDAPGSEASRKSSRAFSECAAHPVPLGLPLSGGKAVRVCIDADVGLQQLLAFRADEDHALVAVNVGEC